jgi:RNA polymerase sigma factor (sigma-70 family)
MDLPGRPQRCHIFHAPRKEQETPALPIDQSIIERIEDNREPEKLADEITSLYRFINRLDELNRALMLLYLDDRPHQEIAEILGITQTNVATKISRVKERLRHEFNAESNISA